MAKEERLQVNYGLVTDERGCPVAVSVFAGNESDSTTLMPQVEMVRNRFGIKTLVLVGDRGMISQKRIDDDLRNLEGVDWITALKSASIRKLIDGGQLQLGLFDERNLFELTHPDFAGERLFACRNTELAKLRVHKRQSLLQATARELARIQTMVQRARLRGKDKIGARVRKVVTKTLAKYFVLDIRDDDFTFQIPNKEVAAKAALVSTRGEAANVELAKVRTRSVRAYTSSSPRRSPNISPIFATMSFASESCAQRETGEHSLGRSQGQHEGHQQVQGGQAFRAAPPDFHIDEHKVTSEATLDGIYVIRRRCCTALAESEIRLWWWPRYVRA